MASRILRTALIQAKVGLDKIDNLKNTSKLISEAKNGGAKLVSLSEYFNSPIGIKYLSEYGECIPNGPTSEMLSKSAKEHCIYLIGGSIPEVDNKNYYNTCTVYNPQGELIAKFRKMHLFDGFMFGDTFKESSAVHAGNELVTFMIKEVNVKVGLGICHDLKFEEMAKLYQQQGCELLVYPAVFNMNTGPIYWELLQKTRALDNQAFVITISPARGERGFKAWGHSQITDPLGKIIASADHQEKIVYGDIDFDKCDKLRQKYCKYSQRRTDVYEMVQKK